jgi:hypothetical protein
MNENTEHTCVEPKSVDFTNGTDAAGCWTEEHLHYQQVVGSSGIYLVVTDTTTGEIIRDDRPWQMTV